MAATRTPIEPALVLTPVLLYAPLPEERVQQDIVPAMLAPVGAGNRYTTFTITRIAHISLNFTPMLDLDLSCPMAGRTDSSAVERAPVQKRQDGGNGHGQEERPTWQQGRGVDQDQYQNRAAQGKDKPYEQAWE